MRVTNKAKVLLLFGTRGLYVLSIHLSSGRLPIYRSVIIFAALRLMSLPFYAHSPNPTFSGISAAAFGLAEVSASLITTTTPLAKSFLVEFRVVGQKPTIIFSRKYGNGTASRISDLTPDPGRAGKNADPEKSSATSSLTMEESDSTTTTSGSTKSHHEPWNLQHDGTYTKTNVTPCVEERGGFSLPQRPTRRSKSLGQETRDLIP